MVWIHDFPELHPFWAMLYYTPGDSHQRLSLTHYLVYHHHLRECHLPTHIITSTDAQLTMDGKPDLLCSGEHPDSRALIFLELRPAIWRSCLLVCVVLEGFLGGVVGL
jgi:hypothetical protein